MVRGRRVKAIVAETHSSGNNYYSPKRKNKRSGQCNKLVTVADTRIDHCITQYFKIESVQDQSIQPSINSKDSPYNRKIPLKISYDCPDIKIKQNFGEEKHVATIKDNYLIVENEENLSKVFVSSSPHRIEFCPQIPDSNGVNLQGKIKSDLKFNVIKQAKTKLDKKETTGAHKLTEYFPVRRSVRKTKQTILEEKQKEIEECLRNGMEEGLEVHNFEGKGRGVVTTRPFNQGDFVVEYSGELLDVAKAKHREKIYAQDLNTGCYMYYFKYHNQQYCVDATAESGRFGRLVNHSRNGNLLTRTIVVDGLPHLVLIAKEYIKPGDEITYDYGDRSKESLKNHPWLAF